MRASFLLLPFLLLACDNAVDDPTEVNEEELITTVLLDVTDADGMVQTFSWADPEDDGSPVIDDLVLAADSTVSVSIRFLNELSSPVEDITEEIEEEDDEHQVFFGLEDANGLLTHTYDDMDAGGLPVGLDNTFEVGAAGTGELVVTLRHLPAVDDAPQKVAGLAETVESDGLSAIAGESDVSVTFPLVVEAAE